MIEDINHLSQGARLQADVCIVGAGPAGISLALDLCERGLSVVLLESGRLGPDAATQALSEGSVADEALHSPPDKYRVRQLGGASAIWGGRCMPLDPLDFEARAAVPLSGWPISYADLLPYYPAANALAEAGRFAYSAADALGLDALPMIRGFASSRVSTDGLERFSCPTNFGQRYARRLALAPRLQLLLGANCTSLRLSEDGRSLSHVNVASLQGRRLSVHARATVLAAGGLETARLLLASRDVAPAGVGNQHDVVGRYYMCHLAGNVGQLDVRGAPSEVRHGYEISPDGIYCRRRLAVLPAEQARLGLANAVARLHFARITDPAHGSGVLSALYLARHFISYEYAKRLSGASPRRGDTWRHALNVLQGPLETGRFAAHWLRRRTLAARKFPSVILRNRSNRFSLEVHGEQRPLAHSRVTLSERRDALGMPQLRVAWRYSPDDIDSLRRTLTVMGEEFEASGAARLQINHATLEEDLLRFGAYGGHHIGTARMGTDPRCSVVNADCQVHGVNHLFVTGSAVFPTSSQANPTLTLIALALRLGATLGTRLSRAPLVLSSGALRPPGTSAAPVPRAAMCRAGLMPTNSPGSIRP